MRGDDIRQKRHQLQARHSVQPHSEQAGEIISWSTRVRSSIISLGFSPREDSLSSFTCDLLVDFLNIHSDKYYRWFFPRLSKAWVHKHQVMNVTRAINGESNITGNHSFHPITKTAFLGSTWGTCLVAAILFAVRLRLRRRDHRYLVFDDFFVLIAFICLVSNQAILTISASDIFSFEQVRLHWTALTENDSRHASYFLKCTFSMNILYCGTIWSSKAGLLLLFRRVYPSSRWSVFIWVSFGIVFATFLLSLVLYSLACTRFTRGRYLDISVLLSHQ